MRLIDAEPIERDIAEWKARETNEPLTKTIVDNVGTLVTHAPTIEAIPVSYIQKRANTYYSKAYKNALNTIIRDWQEDKELKNNE